MLGPPLVYRPPRQDVLHRNPVLGAPSPAEALAQHCPDVPPQHDIAHLHR